MKFFSAQCALISVNVTFIHKFMSNSCIYRNPHDANLCTDTSIPVFIHMVTEQPIFASDILYDITQVVTVYIAY